MLVFGLLAIGHVNNQSFKGDSDWSYSWVPVIGPIVGEILEALLFKMLF